LVVSLITSTETRQRRRDTRYIGKYITLHCGDANVDREEAERENAHGGGG
jgi:hypothetical protein